MTVNCIRRAPFLENWKFIVLILAPIVLLPIILVPDVGPPEIEENITNITTSTPTPSNTTEETSTDAEYEETEMYEETNATTIHSFKLKSKSVAEGRKFRQEMLEKQPEVLILEAQTTKKPTSKVPMKRRRRRTTSLSPMQKRLRSQNKGQDFQKPSNFKPTDRDFRQPVNIYETTIIPENETLNEADTGFGNPSMVSENNENLTVKADDSDGAVHKRRVKRSPSGAYAWTPENKTKNASAKTKPTTAINPRNKFKCAYVIILMAIYWMIEALPLAVTALLPIVLFPLLGVQDTTKVSLNYMKETNMMFVGGLMIALAVEYANLHKRIALKVMTLVGSSPVRLLFGIMMTTMLLSMWISNTAATAMMVPIVLAVLEELHKSSSPDEFKMNVIEGTKGKMSMNPDLEGPQGVANPAFVADENQEEEKTAVKRFGFGPRTESVNTLRPTPEFESGFGAQLKKFHKYILSVEDQNEEIYLKKMTLTFFYAILVGANIGGVFWPYDAPGTSMPLYWLTKNEFRTTPLDVRCEDLAKRGNGSGTWTCPMVLEKSTVTLDYKMKRFNRVIAVASNGLKNGTNVQIDDGQGQGQDDGLRNMRVMFLLGIAYASNLGGTGVNVGQNGRFTDLTFATWMAYSVPGMLINVLIAWIYLIVMFFGLPEFMPNFLRKKDKKGGQVRPKSINSEKVNRLLMDKYKGLGPMTFHESAVAILFVIVVALWFFRDPRFVPGWASLIKGVRVGDSTAAMGVVIFLFIIPKSFKFLDGVTDGGKIKTLLEWKYVQSNLPWAIILLMGGGFAISDAAEHSGLSEWLGQQLDGLVNLPYFATLLIVMLITAMITEVASNTACANLILPILITLSKRLQIHPLYLALPAAISCSFAFMLPVASAPNAIIYEAAGDMKITQMMKIGWVLNLTCILVLFLLNITYGAWLFGFDSYEYPPLCAGCPDMALRKI